MPIPDDHLAAKDLQRQFRELGRERQAPAVARTKRIRRGAILSVAVTGVAAVGAGAAHELASEGSDVGNERSLPVQVQRAPADGRLSSASVPDPGGGLAWGARTYVSRAGSSCIVVGRLSGGRLGVLHRGSFHELTAAAPGTCASSRNGDPLVEVRRYLDDGGPARTVAYGVVSREVRSVVLTVGARHRSVAISDDGVYIAVFAGAALPASTAIRFRTDAKTITRRLS